MLVKRPPRVSASWTRECDVVVVGAGAAGLCAALEISRRGRRVVVVAKGRRDGGSTPLAQGGLAAVTGADDSYALHVGDTLIAAAGLAEEAVVRELVAAAPGVVRYLGNLGVRFDEGAPGLEGGHSRRRIVHAGGDAIGAALHRALCDAVARTTVELLEGTVAVDALLDEAGRVVGLAAGRVGDNPGDPIVGGVVRARAVVIATGGLGQVFATTTNPPDVTGDGLALAARAGAPIVNVEFVQFHPTALYVRDAPWRAPLITEALRGAGARIVDAARAPVMVGRHALGDLAPRDVVAYEMFQRIHASSDALDHLWLDARSLGAARLEREFPTTLAICRAVNVDPATDLIPIAPAAHYSCGGVRADLDGSTAVPGLYAIGEAAATGVHGANRLASNSLTEALVSGRRVAQRVDVDLVEDASRHFGAAATPEPGRGADPGARSQWSAAMTNHAGVVRDRDGLERARAILAAAGDGPGGPLDLATLEATNLHTASLMITLAALAREESRGSHRRRDFPATRDEWARPLTLSIRDVEVVAHLDETLDA